MCGNLLTVCDVVRGRNDGEATKRETASTAYACAVRAVTGEKMRATQEATARRTARPM